ncbi:hypothetical protein DRH27_03905 [Candidatus Falkowbacteria bacterium]|nr:MAG: hypothetical protein DRH27_03905 [Candidatus Falkowbacteria bacterium]
MKNISKFRLTLAIIFVILGISVFFYVPKIVIGQGSDTEIVNKEIQGINSDIKNRQEDIQKIEDKKKQLSEEIKKRQKEKSSLNNQLAILDNRQAKSELDIEITETEIETVKLGMQKTDIEIEDKNKEIDKEKTHIAGVLNLIYKRDNVSSLEIILLNKSLSDFLSNVKYLEDINEEIKDSVDDINKLKRQLENEKKALESQNEDLNNLKNELVEKSKKLEEEKGTKIHILTQVGKSEREYQRLLAEAKKEQEDAAAEIASMEKLVRAKIAKLEGHELGFNDDGLTWPVTKNVITAYFHDPDYPFRYIFEHPAIDIRAGQGTVLKAAASGYVARAKAGPNGSYGYIMIIHGDGLSTVYGHVSKISVSEDDYVIQGQKIGLSGGMPGTPGAGRLTTGPHLHFEVRLNGIPVDPLSYLP